MPGFIENENFRKLLLSYPGKAIGFLYDHYYQSLVSIAKTLTRDEKASEDIVQETLLHVWENHRQLGQYHERSIEHYLVRVVRNKSISLFKRNLKLRFKNSDFIREYTLLRNDPTIEDQMIRLEINTEIRNAIATFPQKERECLMMRLDEELTTDQMAERLKVTKKAIERSLTSGNKRLKKYWLSKK